jgi:hypothetical protein
MSTAALVWLDERAAADVAAWRTGPFVGGPRVGAVRYLLEVLGDCDGGPCLCVCEPKAWQRGCPTTDLPAAQAREHIADDHEAGRS